MKDKNKIRQPFMKELTDLRKRISELEKSEVRRKKAEAALRESETKFRRLAENYPDVIYRFDKEHRYLYVNPTITKYTGKPPAYYIGKTPEEIGHPQEECQYWRKMAEQVFQTGQPLDGEAEVSGPKGKGYILWHMIPEFDEDSHIISILSTERDITERRKMEQLMADEKNRAQMYLDIAGVMLIVIGVDKKVQLINKKGCEILGHSEKEIIGKNWFKNFLPARIRKETEKVFEELIQGKINPARYYENSVLTKSGEERIIGWFNTFIPDKKGKIICTLSSGTDITESKKSADQLRESCSKLQRTLRGTVHALASTVGKRDPFTQSHQLKVTKLACCIAEKLHLPEDRVKGLRFAGLLHDIGKISVPAEILTKPGRLTNAEYRIIKTHAQHAYDILKDIEFPWPIADIVLQHHERLDGSGYPQGLKDSEILLEAKILMVADVVEAMSSHRPYRPAPGVEKALDEIKKNRGILYESRVVDICIQLFKQHNFNFNLKANGVDNDR